MRLYEVLLHQRGSITIQAESVVTTAAGDLQFWGGEGGQRRLMRAFACGEWRNFRELDATETGDAGTPSTLDLRLAPATQLYHQAATELLRLWEQGAIPSLTGDHWFEKLKQAHALAEGRDDERKEDQE